MTIQKHCRICVTFIQIFVLLISAISSLIFAGFGVFVTIIRNFNVTSIRVIKIRKFYVFFKTGFLLNFSLMVFVLSILISDKKKESCRP